jgi:hypothetical protein
MMYFPSLLLCITVALLVSVDAAKRKPSLNGIKATTEAIPLGVGEDQMVFLSQRALKKNRYSGMYCIEEQPPATVLSALLGFFSKTTIVVESSFPLSWYAVRGISSDDLYNNVRSSVFKYVFRMGEEDEAATLQSRDAREGYGWARDLLSSCPSPLWGSPGTSKCEMAFSAVGTPCVILDLKESVAEYRGSEAYSRKVKLEVTLVARQAFYRRGAVLLLAALALFKLSGTYSVILH